MIAGVGSSQEVTLGIKGAKRLVLFVKDGGDNFHHDHAVWVDPILHGANGTLKLTDLEWTYADAGWGEAQVNLTCDSKPLQVGGKIVEGIGTHAESTIIYDLPDGYERFTAKGVVTDRGSVVFGVMAVESTGALAVDTKVSVDFEELCGFTNARVRDLWADEDLGEFEGAFFRDIPSHGAGLYRVTPLP